MNIIKNNLYHIFRKDKDEPNNRGFTLIELTVVMSVVATLVLLAAPNFTKQTNEATRTKHIANISEIESASERYHVDEGDWPRLTDDPYASEQIAAYAETIFDETGKVVTLDPDGSYYNIDYDKLDKYVKVDNADKHRYILQNPKGKVFYLENLTTEGEMRVDYGVAPEESDNEEGQVLEGPIPIATAEELNNLRNAIVETYGAGTQWEGLYEGGLDKEYIQVADIDLSEYSEKEEGWNPIGYYIDRDNNESFAGIYDGGNYVIKGLEVKGDSNKYQGLFGLVKDATIRNVGLIENKATGFQYVGGLVGAATSSKISNSYATGEIEGRSYVGGLVGRLTSSTIEDSHATGLIKGGSKVNGSGTYIGGLVGSAGTVWNLSDTEISNSYFTGSIETTGSQIGGLVGATSNRTTVSNSYATGSVNGARRVGGLVGNAGSSIIKDSYFEGSATGTGEGRINSDIYVGGLVGVANKSTIENSYAKASTTATGKSINRNTDEVYVGGLVGHDSYKNNIINSYAEGSVTGSGEGTGQYSVPIYAGGLVGFAEYDKSTISNSYATGPVTGTGTGKVTINVGGLVGYVRWGSTEIINSYATGSVTGSGTGTNYAGGLVGRAYDGDGDSSIVNSYAIGPVTVTGKGGTGGLVGSGDSTPINIKNSYWDINTTGQTSSHEGGTGLTTDEMKNQATYPGGDEGWDFTNIWEITPGNYPTLR